MKKKYEKPVTDINHFDIEYGILVASPTSGEDLNKRSYGDEEGEDAGSFWK